MQTGFSLSSCWPRKVDQQPVLVSGFKSSCQKGTGNSGLWPMSLTGTASCCVACQPVAGKEMNPHKPGRNRPGDQDISNLVYGAPSFLHSCLKRAASMCCLNRPSLKTRRLYLYATEQRDQNVEVFSVTIRSLTHLHINLTQGKTPVYRNRAYITCCTDFSSL